MHISALYLGFLYRIIGFGGVRLDLILARTDRLFIVASLSLGGIKDIQLFFDKRARYCTLPNLACLATVSYNRSKFGS